MQSIGICLWYAKRRYAASSDLPVRMRAKHSAYLCIESGFQRTKSLAGGAGVAAHPCRPPRRRTASIRIQELEHSVLYYPRKQNRSRSNQPLELAFLGGASGVGASCLALDIAGRRVLID